MFLQKSKINIKGNVKPLGNTVLVSYEELDEKLVSGIVIPNRHTETDAIQGQVLAIGSKVKDVKVGDNIMYADFAGSSILNEEDAVVFINEKDIMVIILDKP